MTRKASKPAANGSIQRGRGTGLNPQNRFEKIDFQPAAEAFDPDAPSPRTTFYRDTARSLITSNDSPDLGFEFSLNPYRGCEHGCIYCYARPYHEFLGLSAGLDFETKIFVKEDAPAILREELLRESWNADVLVMCGVTDCYQPVEKKLELTRGCLKVLAEFRNPVAMITKNSLVTRDADLLSDMARDGCAHVTLSVTTLDAELQRRMEPRASTPRARLAAMRLLADAGVPVGVNVAPIIPGLTDHEVPAILQAARDHGAASAGYTVVRLPHALTTLFDDWLQGNFPDRKAKVLNRLRQMHDGRLYQATWGARMHGVGPLAEQIADLFAIARRRAGFPGDHRPPLNRGAFRRLGQLRLFD
ncbi:PA0069 family radical SAM protein [Candidatus Sumerlaeota bacterium]|nr:PA0069 family radical SAM protein [Candidatus Sumerlaeota bacterium]